MEKIKDLPSLPLLLYYLSEEEERYTESEDDYLHAADLYNLCARQVFLLRREGKRSMRYVPPKTKLLWEMGKALEHYIKTQLEEAGVLMKDNPALINEEYGIIGHPDAILVNDQILEIKGKDPAIFKMMRNGPLRRDQTQVHIYLWLKQARTARLLAATWGNAGKNPYREFTVGFSPRVPELVKRTIAPLREAQAGGALPRRICESANSPRARTCPVAKECFAEASLLGVVKTIGEYIENS